MFIRPNLRSGYSYASQQNRGFNFRFGSKADIRPKELDVRFTPKSGHADARDVVGCCAMQTDQQINRTYSSARRDLGTVRPLSVEN
jgi:hypothetical protein